MARSNVPKFGNWEGEDNVPYTVYFDKARKTKGGKMINPNEPQENPDMFPPPAPAPGQSKPRSYDGPLEPKPAPEHRVAREEGDIRQFSNPPARNENPGQRTGTESNYGGRGPRPGRASRPSAGSDQSFDKSPLHPHYQPKGAGRGGGSPVTEGNRSYDSSHGHGTPGRSRLKPTARDESPDRDATVPKFGDWNDENPQSAENFTEIFKKVREQRNLGTGTPSGTPNHPSYGGRTQQPKENPKKCCCPWW